LFKIHQYKATLNANTYRNSTLSSISAFGYIYPSAIFERFFLNIVPLLADISHG
jgi:hypothetical protein